MPERFDFTKISPADGWRVLRIDRNTYCSLSLELHVGEKCVPLRGDETFITLREWKRPTDADRSDIARLQPLAEAMCRYFNAGGAWACAYALFSRVEFHIGPMDDFGGWNYKELFVDADGNYNHVWVSQSKPEMGLMWTEDVAIFGPQSWDKLQETIYGGETDEVDESGLPDQPPTGTGQLQLGHDPEEP